MKHFPVRVAVFFLSLVVVASGPTALGDTHISDGILDSIDLKADSPGSGPVVVRLFDAGKADLGTGGKGGKPARVEAVKQIQQDGPGILASSLVAELTKLGGFEKVSQAEGPGPAGSIIVDGRFTIIDPGSRAKRYWAGFGAGKGRTAIEGTVKSASGEVLAEFQHQRLIVMGAGGGNYVRKMSADCERLGEDIAEFLHAWATGKRMDD